jgi:tRNA(Ile)-lysidine synthase
MPLVNKALSEFNWKDKELLVSCSGGLDSTVLLHGIVQLGIRPKVLHINYKLRGAESDADEAHVRTLVEYYQLESQIVSCPKERLKGAGINLQAAARDFRRTFYQEWTAKSKQHVVLLGQHADDQIETFFLQLFRGAGMQGLGGMYPERQQLIRPFLNLTKEDLKEYAHSEKVTWREDHSNTEVNYLRNRFRKKKFEINSLGA